MNRWITYFQERFPLHQHGPLIAAFSICAICYSALLTNTSIHYSAILVAFIVSLIFFLQLRIADECKDAEEDLAYRPYRPVPRGLVTLKELKILFALGAIIQLILTLYLAPKLCLILFIAWAYLALMSVEFFARDWLKARPVIYLLSHMLIMPLVDLFATACQWLPQGCIVKYLLIPFLLTSFCNGLVIELGRKLRQPEQEETGVPTYSKLWGLRKASFLWVICILLTLVFGSLAAFKVSFLLPFLTITTPLFLAACCLSIFSSHFQSKHFEILSGIWTLILYLALGILPYLIL